MAGVVFDGKKIRDLIIKDLADKVVLMTQPPTLAEILIGDDPVSTQYAKLKEKMALKAGVLFCLYKFDGNNSEKEVLEAIEYLNKDIETTGIMIQIPVPKGFDRDKLISAISPEKDVDGLRYCLGLTSNFVPPVVLAILEALKQSNVISTSQSDEKSHESAGAGDLSVAKTLPRDDKKIVIIGHGFLVGAPLVRFIEEKYKISPLVISTNVEKSFDEQLSEDSSALLLSTRDDIKKADVIISAVGKAGLIKPEMIKDGVILIDAGTAESNGELVGDVDPKCYTKASFHTPVPGGIGPVTIAMLLKNIVKLGK